MLKGSGVTLRPVSQADIGQFKLMRNDTDLQLQLMSRARGSNDTRVNRWIESRADEETTIFLVIAETMSNEAVGFIQAINIDFISGTCWLGIGLLGEAQGRGHGFEALNLFTEYLRHSFSIRLCTLFVLKDNARAVNFYTRNRFDIVGTLEEHFLVGNKYVDVLIMRRKTS
jgi:RimJ/RimL family protein N-acetyltransferase